MQDSVRFWVLPQLNHLELLHATYVKHVFAKHIHDCYAIGVIEQGALAFSYRGEKLIAPPGTINLVIPGEAHDGSAASDLGWTYRMFYLTPDLLVKAAREIAEINCQPPFFKAGIVNDPPLASLIRNLHLQLEQPGIDLLAQESLLLTMLVEFVLRHSENRPALCRTGEESLAVKIIREYIDSQHRQNISLHTLSGLCHLSPFHLLRVFKKSVGIPPHIYLMHVRIKRAKELLAKRLPLAAIAQETGFTDQSHFAKHFKQVTGISPGKYSNFIQDFSHRSGKIINET